MKGPEFTLTSQTYQVGYRIQRTPFSYASNIADRQVSLKYLEDSNVPSAIHARIRQNSKFWTRFKKIGDGFCENLRNFSTKKTIEETKMLFENTRRACGCTQSSLVKPFPSRSFDVKPDKWFDDFLENRKPLREYANNFPHMVRAENVIETLISRKPPAFHAVWYVKILFLNQFEKTLKQASTSSNTISDGIRTLSSAGGGFGGSSFGNSLGNLTFLSQQWTEKLINFFEENHKEQKRLKQSLNDPVRSLAEVNFHYILEVEKESLHSGLIDLPRMEAWLLKELNEHFSQFHYRSVAPANDESNNDWILSALMLPSTTNTAFNLEKNCMSTKEPITEILNKIHGQYVCSLFQLS